ncbi:coupling of ubiquitin conjugation to ER degradation protein 1 [[Candida] anglica]|uniref:Coupling of ubiquitin conjugation to ER degradation protein 1 n=1 Tax=[Candida] anglica TaxID=148631 RepID=A0ABP0EEX4_9ASCO
MDTSTLIFIGTLLVAFVVMRWLISPVPQAIESDLPGVATTGSRSTRTPTSRSPRPISDSMIEVVQSIGPQLSVGQIRMDLERSGSVEATIERFMETGGLPFPPGESAQQQQQQQARTNSSNSNGGSKIESENLIEKFGLSDKVKQNADNNEEEEEEVSNKWGSNKQERSSNLAKRREEMILKARKRLESQLKNEVNL